MKNKIIPLILLSIILTSCISNNEKVKQKNINSNKKIEISNSGKIIVKSGTGNKIKNNSGTISIKNLEIIKEKETLKEIIKNKKVKTENTGAITTDKLLDDISENYDKEIEDEILKLFE